MSAPVQAPPRRTGDQIRATDLLHALTGLVTDGAVPEPRLHATFWANQGNGQRNAEAVHALLSSLPGPWEMEPRTVGTARYLKFTSGACDVIVYAPAADVATETGERAVTDWAPAPEIASLLWAGVPR